MGEREAAAQTLTSLRPGIGRNFVLGRPDVVARTNVVASSQQRGQHMLVRTRQFVADVSHLGTDVRPGSFISAAVRFRAVARP